MYERCVNGVRRLKLAKMDSVKKNIALLKIETYLTQQQTNKRTNKNELNTRAVRIAWRDH